ncbi:MAG: hypothetical protein WAW17_14595 [Rhodococcus sp. (in: high G+C Gram-positive bacteria)]|uniref:hypothetical protein n=1 Tax=Rhodococcus sp. TaxID=1831 RepID=UPI003BAE7F6B
MLEAAKNVHQSETIMDKAFSEAFGAASDHHETPSVLAVVSRNRLIGLEIDDSVIDMYRNDPVTLGVYLNTIIRGAFENWRDDVRKRMQS